METEWDESFFGTQQEHASIYWVCFWTGDDIRSAAQHDPQRVTGAESIEEVISWISRERGERRYELFVETLDHAESRSRGWAPYRKLLRLAGDFDPAGTSVTIPFVRTD